MKQKMSISYIRLIGNHTLSCAILGINCTPNGLKLHLLRSCYYFRPLLVHLFPNCTQIMRLYIKIISSGVVASILLVCNSIRLPEYS